MRETSRDARHVAFLPKPRRSRSPRSLYTAALGHHNRVVTATTVRAIGLGLSCTYAAFALWLFAAQPRTVAEVTGGIAAGVGAYHVDEASFAAGLAFFRRDQFAEARSAFARADPAQRDPRTQFYIAYSYYREGWGRTYSDDALFSKGLEAARRAVEVSPNGHVEVSDPDLKMSTSDELVAELQRGLTRDVSDLNPLRLLEERK